jgi:DNA-binding transcriptional ArsR family regulator
MERKAEPQSVDAAMVKMLAHPLRVQILIALNDRVASPEEISGNLGQPLESVIRHIKVLQEHDSVELVKIEKRNSGSEHFYRAVRRQFLTDEDWEKIPRGLRAEIAKVILQALLNDVDDAMVNGTFAGLDDYHLSRTPMVVDKAGWDEVTLLLADTLDRVLEIQAAASARLAATREEGLRTKVSILHFKSPQAEFS